jgi:hypothetical protein
VEIVYGREYYRGKYHCTVDLLFDWFGISSLTTDDFCFYLQNRLIQAGLTGGQWYSDTSPFSIPWFWPSFHFSERHVLVTSIFLLVNISRYKIGWCFTYLQI